MLQVYNQNSSSLLVHVAHIDVMDTIAFFWFWDIFDFEPILITWDFLYKVLVDLRKNVIQVQLNESNVAINYVVLDKIEHNFDDEIFFLIYHAIHHSHGLSLLNPIKERVYFTKFLQSVLRSLSFNL